MHYADFAEDEVFHLGVGNILVNLTLLAERSSLSCNQRIRGKQMEGDWAKGWQAGESKRIRTLYPKTCLAYMQPQACEQYAKEHFGGRI